MSRTARRPQTLPQIAEHLSASYDLPVHVEDELIILPLETGRVTISREVGKHFNGYTVEAHPAGSDEPVAAKVVFSTAVLGAAAKEAAAALDPTITPDPRPEPASVARHLAALTVPTRKARR